MSEPGPNFGKDPFGPDIQKMFDVLHLRTVIETTIQERDEAFRQVDVFQEQVASLRAALSEAVEALEPFAEAFEGMPWWGGLANDWLVWLYIGEKGTPKPVIHHVSLLIQQFRDARDALDTARKVGVK